MEEISDTTVPNRLPDPTDLAQWVKTLATAIPGTHIKVERDNLLHKAVHSPPCMTLPSLSPTQHTK